MADIPNEETVLSDMHILREAIEEIGVTRADFSEETLKLLGITRELIRGGEPELFFSVRTKLSANDMRTKHKDARDFRESRELHFFDFGHLAFDELTSDQSEKFTLLVESCIDKFGADVSSTVDGTSPLEER